MQRLTTRVFWITLLLSFTVSLLLPMVSSSTLKSAVELRGVWLTNIDSDVLFDSNKTANAINTLSVLNFNTLYPTVWNSGYTLYPSLVADKSLGIPIYPTPELEKRDLIQEIIEGAHAKNMRVIPWFEFGFMAPAESQLAKLHPDWLTQRLDGGEIWLEGNIHPRVWLNPLHPEVQEFISDLIIEIVSNYPVDGIQLDDHFGYPADFGYDPLTVELYKQEHFGKTPPTDYQNQEWIQWRAGKITEYMEKLFTQIKQANQKAIVSLSPNPQQFSLNQYLLDWATWERKGLVEELVLQVYRQDLNSFSRELSQPEVKAARSHIPVAIGILAGLKGRPVDFKTIETQVETVREQNFAGVSFFFFESLWYLSPENPRERLLNLQKLFS